MPTRFATLKEQLMKPLAQSWWVRGLGLAALALAMDARAAASADEAASAASAAAASAASTPALMPALGTDGQAMFVVVALAALIFTGLISAVVLLAWPRNPDDPKARPWRLADALSEEVPFVDAAGHPQPMLVASASRLIAFLGLLVNLSLYIGAGLCVLYAFIAGKASANAIESIWKFVAAGAGLFLPYLANQLRAGLENKAEAKTPAAPDLSNAGQDQTKPVQGIVNKPTTPTQVPAGPSV